MTQKRAFLIHGWRGRPKASFRGWLGKELTKENFKVEIPCMPGWLNPQMQPWVDFLHKKVGTPDENCYLVGHSLGCIGILRYLESLKNKQKIGGVILVAGFTSDLGFPDLKSFFQTEINWKKIKKHCKNFVFIYSDNDYYVSTHYADIFKKNLNAKLIFEKGKGHFSSREGCKDLPVALESILKMSKEISEKIK